LSLPDLPQRMGGLLQGEAHGQGDVPRLRARVQDDRRGSGQVTRVDHACGVAHRSYMTLARCEWPRHEWITGDGAFALLAWCRVLTITLWDTYWSAFRASVPIDPRTGTGCGGKCHGAHQIVHIRTVVVAA
jgi:hypothetical protein